MNICLEDIFNKFSTGYTFCDAGLYGSGNINDTYLVNAFAGDAKRRFFLQRINNYVFPLPSDVMANTIKVTQHLSAAINSSSASEVSNRVLHFYSVGSDSLYYYRGPKGGFWRLCDYIDGATAYDSFESVDMVKQAAIAFGQFQRQLIDLPADSLKEVISGFLDGRKKYSYFKMILEADPAGRAESVASDIEQLVNDCETLDYFPRLIENGSLPLRVIHNDCKINNVMMDDITGRGVCVIDLDTVMPGIVHYDFGDYVRSVLSSSSDIDTKLNEGMIDFDIFTAAADGYISEAVSFLSEEEVKHLHFAPCYMSLLLACRFLADYLAGDVYFKTHSPDHNLVRFRSQLSLYHSLMAGREIMKEIIENSVKKHI